MDEENWGEGYAKTLGVYLNGKAIPNPNPKGEPVTDDSFYLIFNAHHEDLEFILPPQSWGRNWVLEFDTCDGCHGSSQSFDAGKTIEVDARTLTVLRCTDED